MSSKTLFQKVWSAHEVVPETAETPAVLYVDLHLTHEVSSPQAFQALRSHGLLVRSPSRTMATLDHATPTDSAQLRGDVPFANIAAAAQVDLMNRNAQINGIEIFGLNDPRRGIVHVIAPELGLTQPGMTIVCGDSHTSTHGAFGALAFGIGTTEVGHVLATQCILQRKPKAFVVNVSGALAYGVTAKDLILAIIQTLTVSGGTGHIIEYRGPTIVSLSMEERMTVCNMSIEAGARGGMIAPDEITFAYLKNRARAPRGLNWYKQTECWSQLFSDPDAVFDAAVDIEVSGLSPMITYGTNPGMVMPVNGVIPASKGDSVFEKALRYMGVAPGESLLGKPVNVVFVGSCTNGRLSDLQAAASILRGRKVAQGVRMLVVPGSQQVKREAEATGIADILRNAGAEWRESGCSMCIGMNGDTVTGGHYCVSTSNRNFEGRQGAGARTLLASPLTAAASAVRGCVTDPRDLVITH